MSSYFRNTLNYSIFFASDLSFVKLASNPPKLAARGKNDLVTCFGRGLALPTPPAPETSRLGGCVKGKSRKNTNYKKWPNKRK